MIAEASQWDFKLTMAAMSDPAVADKVAILAAHHYGTARIAAPPRTTGNKYGRLKLVVSRKPMMELWEMASTGLEEFINI